MNNLITKQMNKQNILLSKLYVKKNELPKQFVEDKKYPREQLATQVPFYKQGNKTPDYVV